jgi:hypothetical protein
MQKLSPMVSTLPLSFPIICTPLAAGDGGRQKRRLPTLYCRTAMAIFTRAWR